MIKQAQQGSLQPRRLGCLFPRVLLVAALIKFDSSGTVLLKQERIGYEAADLPRDSSAIRTARVASDLPKNDRSRCHEGYRSGNERYQAISALAFPRFTAYGSLLFTEVNEASV